MKFVFLFRFYQYSRQLPHMLFDKLCSESIISSGNLIDSVIKTSSCASMLNKVPSLTGNVIKPNELARSLSF